MAHESILVAIFFLAQEYSCGTRVSLMAQEYSCGSSVPFLVLQENSCGTRVLLCHKDLLVTREYDGAARIFLWQENILEQEFDGASKF